MIGVVPFLFPMILTASAAAAAPVIIHLMMRTKPRLVIFPAMRFVLKTHRANLSKLKLKHLILLAMRMLMIVLIAFLLARSQIPQWSASPVQALPTAAVVIVDNSASMGYKYRGRALLEHAKRMAAKIVESLPDGSLVLVLSTDKVGLSGKFLGSRDLVTRQILDIAQGYGQGSTAMALSMGVQKLDNTELPRKEVYVISDMTAQAWRDEVNLTKTKDVRFVLVDCWGGQDVNFSLGQLDMSATAMPVGTEVKIDTGIQGHRVAGQLKVHIEMGGRKIEERPVSVAAGSSAPISFTVVPKRQGVLHGRVVLDRDDPLAMDNVRYFTIHVNRSTSLLILRDPTTIGRGDPTTFLMGNAISPSGRSATGRGWVQRKTISADALTALNLATPHVVLASNVSALPPAQWMLLEKYVRNGGRLWIVVGPLTSVAAYNSEPAQRLMPVSFKAQEESADGIAWKTDKLDHPMLLPFTDPENVPLAGVRCYRRFSVKTVAGDARVVLPYADDVPAIVLRRIGTGQVLLWNFSPEKRFSNLVYPYLPILARRATQVLAGQARADTMHACGRSVVVPFPRGLAGAGVTIRRPGADNDEPVAPDPAGRTVTVLADRPGPWLLRFTHGRTHDSRGFSANTSLAESDMSGADAARVTAMFPPDKVVFAKDLADIQQAWQKSDVALDLTVPLLLALILLMTAESFFANRFYRRSETPVIEPE